jgi:hypothetical protein
MKRLVTALAAVSLLSASAAAAAATTPPDTHDRALIVQLAAKVTTFQKLAATTSNDSRLQKSLDTCPALKKDPSMAFAAIIVLLPVLLIDVVNQAKPQLVDLRDSLAGMGAHQPQFRQWLSAEQQNIGLILAFDNHGKKIDYCKAATVMLAKHSTAQDIRDVLGVGPEVIAKMFESSPTSASAKLKRLNPPMRRFFVAAGLTPKMAKTLTK